MRHHPHRVLAAAALLLGLLLALFAEVILDTQATSRDEVRHRFRERAEISAALTESLFQTSVSSGAVRTAQRYGARDIDPQLLGRRVRQDKLAYLVLLDGGGRVLAVSPGTPDPVTEALATRPAHLRRALTGKTYGLSDLQRPTRTTQALEFAQPFTTRHGPRVLISGFGPELLYEFISGYLKQVPSPRGQVYVLDANGAVIGSPTAKMRPGERLRDPALAAALDRGNTGAVGDDRTFTSAPVAGSPWRVVLVSPTEELSGVVGGSAEILPWLLFVAFALAAGVALWLLRGLLARTAALAMAHERFELAVRGANDGIWDQDLVTGQLYISSRAWAILGEMPRDATPDEDWEARIHPDDLAGFQGAFEAHLAGSTELLVSEHRLCHADGSYAWVLVRGLAIRDEQGRPTRIAGSLSDIGDRKRAEQMLVHDALHDKLTGLPNRTLFVDRLTQSLARAARTPTHRCAVLFLDLDRFKLVNDSFTHAVGDRLLVALAGRLSALLRPGDTLARLGGDEFTILLDDVGLDEATEVARRIERALRAPFRIDGSVLTVSASTGISLGAPGEDAHELLRNADIAMYDAKRAGAGRTVSFTQAMHERVAGQLDLETRLRHALDNAEMRVFYQPIVDLGSGHIAGFEALARWPEGEVPVGPQEFIGVAEDAGLIAPLGRFVMEQACAQLRDWQTRGVVGADVAMSVNVSGRQISDPSLVGDVADVLARTGLRPACLHLEITESTVIDEPAALRDALTALTAQGVAVHIDDFGTGYSPLTFLHGFPGDALKIDRTFVASLGDAGGDEIARGIIALARSLGLDTVAEGVETRAQLDALRSMGCDRAQGYLLAAPDAAPATEAFAATWDPQTVALAPAPAG